MSENITHSNNTKPISAHLTIRYTPNDRSGEAEGRGNSAEEIRVVETILNINDNDGNGIDNDNDTCSASTETGSVSESVSESESYYSLTRTPSVLESDYHGGRDMFNLEGLKLTDSINVNDFYQCVPKFDRDAEDKSTRFIARRFSEPQIANPNRLKRLLSSQSNGGADPSIPRIVSYPAVRDGYISRIPRLRIPKVGNQTVCPDELESTDTDWNLSCPCSRHHHRRNSIAVKFDKALYKKV